MDKAPRLPILIGEKGRKTLGLIYVCADSGYGREGEPLFIIQNGELSVSPEGNRDRIELKHSFAEDDEGDRAALAVFTLASTKLMNMWMGGYTELSAWITLAQWYGPEDSGRDVSDENRELYRAGREKREPDFSELPSILEAVDGRKGLSKDDEDYDYVNRGYAYQPPAKKNLPTGEPFPLQVRIQSYAPLGYKVENMWKKESARAS